MIDLDGLEVHLKEIIDDGRGDECYTKAKNVMRLVERTRQAEKDAERYRWLCTSKIYDQFDSIDQVFYANKGDTDKAIDEAMQCQQ